MNANATLLQKKYAHVIELYANKNHVTPEMALERFYESYLYHQIGEGISDLHCMSDDYLADKLNEEWSQSRNYSIHFVKETDDGVVIRFVSSEKLKLHIGRVHLFDNFGVRVDANLGVFSVVISEDGYSQKIIHFPDKRKYQGVQFVVKNPGHQEQHSIAVCFDGTVNARRMPYNS